jgi:diaminopimelate decarboxylase
VPASENASSEPRPGEDGPEPRDAAYRALNDAYRLVDEYLRQGQKMAENIWLPSAASGAEPSFAAPGRFLLLDAGMNDRVRPAMYGAHHRIEPADWEPGPGDWRVVDPVCESSDDFGTHAIGERAPELVVIRDAGAYAFTMASEYNARPLPAEVFVSDGQIVSVSPSPGVASWLERRLKA